MKPELVLNEEEKKERFKVSIQKRQMDHESSVAATDSHTSLSENSLTDMLEVTLTEPTFSSSLHRSSESSITHSSPRSLVSAFSTSITPYHNRPTVTVAPMPNLSLRPSMSSPIFKPRLIPNTKEPERIQEAPIGNPYLEIPPLPPLQPTASFLSSYQHSNFYRENKSNFSRNLFSQRFLERNTSPSEQAEVPEIKAG